MKGAKKEQPASAPVQRLRVPKNFPTPAESIEVPYAKLRDELPDCPAALTLIVTNSDAWKKIVLPVLDELEKSISPHAQSRRLYDSYELETMQVYQRLAGKTTYKDAHERLSARRQERKLLGFHLPRNRDGKVVKFHDGVPSASTMSRHKKRLPDSRRAELYESLFRELRFETINHPVFAEAVRDLYLDGSWIETRYTCPKLDPETGEVDNAGSVTCWEGGYTRRDSKTGQGWNDVTLFSRNGLPLAYAIDPIQRGESLTARTIFDQDFDERVAPALRGRGVAIASGDSHFAPVGVRAELRKRGILDNIHHVSHSDNPESLKNAREKNAKQYKIAGYPNWFANGHREVTCRCGKRPSRSTDITEGGEVVTRLSGKCESCGAFNATCGDWRLTPAGFVRIDPTNPREQPDGLFGNSLTFNDPLSSVYGKVRFGRNEGFHGAMAKRFNLFGDKRWFRTRDQVRVEVALVNSIALALALEFAKQRSAMAEPEAPPGLALAA